MPDPVPPLPSAGGLLRRLGDRPILAALSLVALFLTVLLAVFTPRYETNDDAYMNLIVAGRAFTDAPDEHLIYSNVLIGLALKGLYRTVPDVPWYGSYLLAVDAAALLGICYALLRANPSGKQLVLIVCFLAAFAAPCVVQVQFTKSAFLAALAGLLLLVTAADGRGDLRQVWTAVPLLLLACLVRFDSCLLACLVLAPALAVTFYRQRSRRPAQLAALVLVGSLACGFGLERYNRWYYAQEESWRDFYDYNTLRAQFTDYFRFGYSARTRTALDAVGWSKVDLAMLHNWNFADGQRFSADKMRIVLASVGPGDRVERAGLWAELRGNLVADVDLLGVLGVGLLSLALMSGGRSARIVPILCLLGTVGVCLLLFEFYHLPRRVHFSAFGGVVAVAIAASTGERRWSDFRPGKLSGVVRGIALLLAAGLLIWQVDTAVQSNRAERVRQQQADEMITRLAPRSDQLFVLWGAAFPVQDLVPPLKRARIPSDFKAVGLLWITPTPFTARRLAEFGITDLYQALTQRSDVFLVTDESGPPLLAAYLSQHYGLRLGGRVVFSHPGLGDSGVYQLRDLNRLSPRPVRIP